MTAYAIPNIMGTIKMMANARNHTISHKVRIIPAVGINQTFRNQKRTNLGPPLKIYACQAFFNELHGALTTQDLKEAKRSLNLSAWYHRMSQQDVIDVVSRCHEGTRHPI